MLLMRNVTVGEVYLGDASVRAQSGDQLGIGKNGPTHPAMAFPGTEGREWTQEEPAAIKPLASLFLSL